MNKDSMANLSVSAFKELVAKPDEAARQKIESLFRHALATPRNPFLDEWLAAGKQVVGYYCLSNPLELVSAAGLLPVRIRGGQCRDGAAGAAYASTQTCSFVRSSMNQLLNRDYDFISGILPQACQQLRRALEAVQPELPPLFKHTITIPRDKTVVTFPFYLAELQQLVARLEEHFQVRLRDADLEKAIQAHDGVRRRVMHMYRLRRRPGPPVTGSQALVMAGAALVLPPHDYNRLMDRWLAGIERGPGVGPRRARVAILGGELDTPEFVEQIESQGALCVAELICFGYRFFMGEIGAGPHSPLERIARFYFFRPPLAHRAVLEEYAVDGVILQRLKFCDPLALSTLNHARTLAEQGIPVLTLEREYQTAATGQIQTRVQAFLEQIGK